MTVDIHRAQMQHSQNAHLFQVSTVTTIDHAEGPQTGSVSKG